MSLWPCRSRTKNIKFTGEKVMSESDGSNLSAQDLRVHIWNTANNHGCIMSIAIAVEAAREAVIKR